MASTPMSRRCDSDDYYDYAAVEERVYADTVTRHHTVTGDGRIKCGSSAQTMDRKWWREFKCSDSGRDKAECPYCKRTRLLDGAGSQRATTTPGVMLDRFMGEPITTARVAKGTGRVVASGKAGAALRHYLGDL